MHDWLGESYDALEQPPPWRPSHAMQAVLDAMALGHITPEALAAYIGWTVEKADYGLKYLAWRGYVKHEASGEWSVVPKRSEG